MIHVLNRLLHDLCGLCLAKQSIPLRSARRHKDVVERYGDRLTFCKGSPGHALVHMLFIKTMIFVVLNVSLTSVLTTFYKLISFLK